MDSQLGPQPGHPFYQQPVEVGRKEAEYILQQIYGQVIGIERMTHEAVQRQLPQQFRLTQL